MKLVSFNLRTPLGTVARIGALDDASTVIDLTLAYAACLHDANKTGRPYEVADAIVPPDMVMFLTGGQLSLEAAKNAVTFVKSRLSNTSTLLGPRNEPICHSLDGVELLAPVPRPNSIRDTISFENHMKNFEKRTGRATPEYWYERPVYYKGNPCTTIGTDADVQWPAFTEKFDYELEYGIYIGKKGRNIAEEDAAEYIAGYTIFNDFSARDTIQKEVSVFLGPAKAKDMDTGNAFGPCLVTPDEIGTRDLKMYARINGDVWSQGCTSDMYWSFAEIIAHVSRDETLYPGDFIGSGTVANGCGDELDRWIQPGDIVELEVEGIGTLRNRIVRRRVERS
jgi:2-keto-4-pentenoate hydratase/2-oxohepta-3-ene-1,7-dioic acid hydratase in catechol pathway